MAKATGRVTDDREVVRAIRLPGARVEKKQGQLERGDRVVESKGKDKVVYRKGQLLTNPDEVVEAMKAGDVKLTELQERGLIAGNFIRE